MSRSKMTNDYDGITHDYSHKHDLMYENVYLPSHAPPEWKDRSILWNSVEASEKTKDSRLSRELIVALPTELTLDENIAMLERFIKEQFVSDGMCADVGIHDTDGHNPHAHIMLTVRPLKADGTWQAKTEKEYLCKRGSEEKAFTASEFLPAQKQGWEKQYLYLVNGKKQYLPPSKAGGFERLNKHPKSSKYGRQNPISERWNSKDQLMVWRSAWADAINRELREHGFVNFVDHRSFKDRGIPYQPTIHEGVIAIALERKGIISERCEYNRQIRKDNNALDYWANAVVELSKVAVLLIADIAKVLEMLFSEICFQIYVWKVTRRAIANAKDTISENRRYKPIYQSKIENASGTLTDKKTELKKAQTEFAHISPLFKKKRKETEANIEMLSEEISELESEISASKSRMKTNAANAEHCEKVLPEYEAYEKQLTEAINEKLAEVEKVKEQAKQFDPDEFLAERMKFRKELEPTVTNRILETYGDIGIVTESEAQKETAELFGDKYATYTDYRNDHPEHKQKDNHERQ